jgi:hypothetical protein
MRKKLLIAAAAAVGMLGGMQALHAVPKGSQRLRGLGDRVFLVDVDFYVFGEFSSSFRNCYVFDADGTWSETLFPTAGTWEQNSTGAKTSYNVVAQNQGFPILQEGWVTPAGGKGVLQLEADTAGPLAAFTFVSVGAEIDVDDISDDAELASAGCPFPAPAVI